MDFRSTFTPGPKPSDYHPDTRGDQLALSMSDMPGPAARRSDGLGFWCARPWQRQP